MSEEEKIKISVNEEDIQNLINCYKEDIKYIMQLEKENKQLKDNWNKLKEWTKKEVDKYYDCDLRVDMVYKNVLDKMQELEKGDSNE